jgi:hypothetical protein
MKYWKIYYYRDNGKLRNVGSIYRKGTPAEDLLCWLDKGENVRITDTGSGDYVLFDVEEQDSYNIPLHALHVDLHIPKPRWEIT